MRRRRSHGTALADMFAELKFVPPMATTPTVDLTGTGETNISFKSHEVLLTDADAEDPPPLLDTHGFCAVPLSASLPEGEIDEAYQRRFSDLCCAALKETTGARLVVGAPQTVAIRRGDGMREEAPIIGTHSDFTPSSTVQRARRILNGLGRFGRPARFAAFNAWWLAEGGPQDRPLALCDATSIAAADVQFARAKVLSAARRQVDFGEVAVVRYSPRQRWYWYPRLGPDRLLLFCGFDSDPSRPSMVMHSAFTNPECPPGAPPRVSVECRCFAFW